MKAVLVTTAPIQYELFAADKAVVQSLRGRCGHTGPGKEKLMKMAFVAGALLLLAACGTTYTHPTKSLQDFDRDKATCEEEAKKALAKKGRADDSCAVLQETKRCLEAKKGWVPS